MIRNLTSQPAQVTLSTSLLSFHQKAGKETIYLLKMLGKESYDYCPYFEKVAADFYHFLSKEEFIVPKAKLTLLKSASCGYRPGDVFIASKFDSSYKPFSAIGLPSISESQHGIICNNVLIKGFIRLLVIGTYLADWDVLGVSNMGNTRHDRNAGLTTLNNGSKSLIKIDTGASFVGLSHWILKQGKIEYINGLNTLADPHESFPSSDSMKQKVLGTRLVTENGQYLIHLSLFTIASIFIKSCERSNRRYC